MPRATLTKPVEVEEDAYESSVRKISSGSYLLDLVLGGGWAVGRIVNIVGDRSSGKTLLAIEACANFDIAIGKGNSGAIRYAEAEAAFDQNYAKSIGMPPSVKFTDPPLETVEGLFADLTAYCSASIKAKRQLGLYVLDSLDALSDEAEMDRDIDKGSYGSAKAKKMSELFRRLNGEIERSHTTMFVISQIRDKLNVTFGETKTRSGGKALDFYATQIIWLAEVGKIKRTVLGLERVIGVKVLVRCKKNKVGAAHRECTLFVYYNYGVDDEESMIDFLRANPKAGVSSAELDTIRSQLSSARKTQDRATLKVIKRNLRQFVGDHWYRIEDALAPPMGKYE
jgi:recombination protein RecA